MLTQNQTRGLLVTFLLTSSRQWCRTALTLLISTRVLLLDRVVLTHTRHQCQSLPHLRTARYQVTMVPQDGTGKLMAIASVLERWMRRTYSGRFREMWVPWSWHSPLLRNVRESMNIPHDHFMYSYHPTHSPEQSSKMTHAVHPITRSPTHILFVQSHKNF